MDFTREPIIETIVTPKEGYKLVVRSSKGTAQEEYFVDAVEVVSFGHALFFRSMERPKSFLVPVADYEILEVREARIVLKNAGLDRSIKIGGGREGNFKTANRESERNEAPVVEEESESVIEQEEGSAQPVEAATDAKADVRLDKKRDRRRHYRKRRGARGEEGAKEEGAAELSIPPLEDEKVTIPPPEEGAEGSGTAPLSSSLLSSLLQPPPTLISETINRYRENAMFKNAFFLTEEEQYKPHDKVQDLLNEDDDEDFAPPLQEPTYVSSEEANEQEDSAIEAQEQLFEDKPELFYTSTEQEISTEQEGVEHQPHSTEEAYLTDWIEPAQSEDRQGESNPLEDFSEEQEYSSEEKLPEESLEGEASLPLYAEEDGAFAEEAFEESQGQNEFVPEEEEEKTPDELVQTEEKKEENPSS